MFFFFIIILQDQVTDLLLQSVHYKKEKNHFQLTLPTCDINKFKVTLNIWNAALSADAEASARAKTQLWQLGGFNVGESFNQSVTVDVTAAPPF